MKLKREYKVLLIFDRIILKVLGQNRTEAEAEAEVEVEVEAGA